MKHELSHKEYSIKDRVIFICKCGHRTIPLYMAADRGGFDGLFSHKALVSTPPFCTSEGLPDGIFKILNLNYSRSLEFKRRMKPPLSENATVNGVPIKDLAKKGKQDRLNRNLIIFLVWAVFTVFVLQCGILQGRYLEAMENDCIKEKGIK